MSQRERRKSAKNISSTAALSNNINSTTEIQKSVWGSHPPFKEVKAFKEIQQREAQQKTMAFPRVTAEITKKKSGLHVPHNSER